MLKMEMNWRSWQERQRTAGAAADGEVKAEELVGVGGAEFRAAQVIGGALTADGEFAGLGFRALIYGFHVLYHPGH
jgi:hypothetical protein